jgi:hypothetical protein
MDITYPMWRLVWVPPPLSCESWVATEGEASYLRQWSVVAGTAGTAGLGPESDCAGEARQRLWAADPVLSSCGVVAPRFCLPAIGCHWWKSGRGPEMGALFRGGLANWSSVVSWDLTQPVLAGAAMNTNAKIGATGVGCVLYSVSLDFMRQGMIADWYSRVWRGVRITSIVALRVVKGDGKGPCAWGFNWVTLFLRDINTGNLPPGWGRLESEIGKCVHKYCGTRTWGWMRWWGLAAIVNDRPILSSERMLYKDHDRKCSIEKKKFLPGVTRRTDWRQSASRKVTLALSDWE